MSAFGVRKLALILMLSAAAALPGGCAGAPSEKTKLVVWGLHLSEEAVAQQAMIKEFERRHPGVDVSVLSMGAGLMNPQKLMTAIVGGKPPDVINQDRFTIGDWASRDTFRPLDDLIARDRDGPLGIRPEDYYEPCWEEATYEGSVFAIPNSTDVRLLYYNRELFRRAGLDPDRPPRTWSELLVYAKKLTVFNKDGSYKSVGFIPAYGNSWLYLYSWTNEGEFMSPDGRTCTLNNPHTVQTLEYLVKVYDALGSAEKLDIFQQGFQGDMLDPFLIGKVAMRIEADQSMSIIARYNPGLDFGVAPAPVPDERFRQTHPNFLTEGRYPQHVPPSEQTGEPEKGRFNGRPRYITWSGGFSWAIPSGAKHTDLAWEFIKWMSSPEAGLIGARAQKEWNESKGRPYIPPMSANMRVNEAVFREYAPKNPKFRNSLEFALELMPYSRYRPVTFVGQRLWDEHTRAMDQAVHYRKSGKTAQAALNGGASVVQRELDKVFGREKSPYLPMPVLLGAIVLVIAGTLGGIYWKVRGSGRVSLLMRREAIMGYVFASPWILGFLALTLGPIVASLIFSFCDYDVLHQARWVGLSNYGDLLGADRYYLGKALYNAGFMAIFGLPLGIVVGLSIAMLLNTKVGGMTWYRTMYYLPSIVPVVANAILWVWVLNPDFGLVNAAWKVTLSQWFGLPPPGWLASETWSKPALILTGLWGAGGGMILWLAGLQGIPQQMYEAADLDGASWWVRLRHITLPMLTPYLFYNMIMGTIGVIQTFESVYIMTRGGPMDSTLMPVLYLFNSAFTYFKMGYASALAWLLFLIIFALTMAQLRLAPRWVYYESEKE